MSKPQTIYIIDDDAALRTAYSAALSKLGYETDTAADGVEGLKLVQKAKPDLILLDMLMPNLDGLGFLKQLRENKDNDDVAVVVTSNFESMPEAEELGISKYMSKMQTPPEEVAAAVDRTLKEVHK